MPVEALRVARDWIAGGHRVAHATVVRTWGSSPCPPGSRLVINDAGAFEGSVSGGCVEAAVIEAAGGVMARGTPVMLEFGITDERAWEVGLACGGTVRIFVQALGAPPGLPVAVLDRMLAARDGGAPMLLLTTLGNGAVSAWNPDAGNAALTGDERAAATRALQNNRCELLTGPAGEVFLQPFQRPLRLVVIGAVHIAQHLAHLAAGCGHDVTIIDPRSSFADPARFPGVDLLTGWPDGVLSVLEPDRRTAVVVLSHDPKLDDPALAAALRSGAYYIGALGSRRNHAARLARLRGLGFADADLARIHGPVGLDIGAAAPAEIAIAIMAELIQSLRK